MLVFSTHLTTKVTDVNVVIQSPNFKQQRPGRNPANMAEPLQSPMDNVGDHYYNYFVFGADQLIPAKDL